MPTRTMTTSDGRGNVLATGTYDISVEQDNQEQTTANANAQATAAITNLRAYIALASPTAAQTTAVVKLLCRVALQLIRLVLSRYDEAD